jgi:hypothetical protein
MNRITVRDRAGEDYVAAETNDHFDNCLCFSCGLYLALKVAQVSRLHDFIGRWLEKHKKPIKAKPRKAKKPKPYTGKLKRGGGNSK